MILKRFIFAMLAGILAVLGVGVVAPTAAQASETSYIYYCIKNSATNSDGSLLVQFIDGTRVYRDYVPKGATEGECGDSNVFSEPEYFLIPAGWCGRWNTVTTGPDSPFSSWIPASRASYPDGRWVTLPNAGSSNYTYYGQYNTYGVQIRDGQTLAEC